jgi:transposase-like protein
MSELSKPHFQDADKAREYLEALRWPNGPVCPHCGTVGGHYTLTGKSTRIGLWKCKDCREQFTVTVGTVFERSKIALNVWLQAVYLLCSSKKGISSHQLHRTLGVTYKTAWFMTHRIREAMKSPGGIMGGGGKTVEADETYWGNAEPKGNRRGYQHKMKVFSLVEREGKVRSFHVNAVNAKTLKPILLSNLHNFTNVVTDEGGHFIASRLNNHFLSHESVNHSAGEYARGTIHTNTIESFFSVMKRGLVGTFHHVGVQHLQRYMVEFDFRYNHRTALGYTDAARTDEALKQIGGKRLTYRRTNVQA